MFINHAINWHQIASIQAASLNGEHQEDRERTCLSDEGQVRWYLLQLFPVLWAAPFLRLTRSAGYMGCTWAGRELPDPPDPLPAPL
jgi:hypothetical protein